MHVARVDEVLSRTPEQTDAGVFLELLQFVADRIELRIGLLEVLAVGAEVAVVPSVVGNTQLGGELEECTSPGNGVLSGALAGIPGTIGGSPAEHITTGSPHGVPIDRGEAHVVAHRLALDHLIRVEVLEGQRILGIRTFVGDPADLGEELLAHVGLEKGRGKLRTDPDDGKRLKLITGRLLGTASDREGACALVQRIADDFARYDPRGSSFPELPPSDCSNKAPPRRWNAQDRCIHPGIR